MIAQLFDWLTDYYRYRYHCCIVIDTVKATNKIIETVTITIVVIVTIIVILTITDSVIATEINIATASTLLPTCILLMYSQNYYGYCHRYYGDTISSIPID